MLAHFTHLGYCVRIKPFRIDHWHNRKSLEIEERTFIKFWNLNRKNINTFKLEEFFSLLNMKIFLKFLNNADNRPS